MNNIFKKMILAVLSAALVFAAFPVTSAFAQGENPPKAELTTEKLEQVWARQLTNYEKIGKGFDDTDAQIAKFQARIDKAAENGKDVTALQAALDAFESAMKSARPTYASMSGIVNSHQGFDANGKVTDAEKAKSTVQEMRTKMQELKSAMGGTGKALREALKAFRAANKPAEAPAASGT
jgi:predicted  nucleic acid-binding Zn-ribbon protein